VQTGIGMTNICLGLKSDIVPPAEVEKHAAIDASNFARSSDGQFPHAIHACGSMKTDLG
jgi:hypothetical protein